MAIYHQTTKMVKRSDGRNAVAAAAYRSGTSMYEEATGHMVADFSLHLDNPDNPHAHILLTTRDLTPEGFGQKNRGWNQTSELLGWRRGWAEVTNEHLAQAGLGVRIDHRSYREQGIELSPGRKLGVGRERQEDERLPSFLADRIEEQQRIAGANGVQIIAEPGIALKAMTHSQATFSHHDLARFLHTRTDGAEQFDRAYLKVTTSPELVELGKDDAGRQRFTTREMLGLERGLLADAEALAGREGHGVAAHRQRSVLSQHRLSDEQRQAFEHVTGPGDLKALVGVAGSGKSTALSAMREAWEAEGLEVKGAALAGIAAENLQVAAGIQSRTLASYELAWSGGRDPLTSKDVLVIDEAGMIGTRQLARILEVAEKAQAKVVLVGDPEQLQAIEAGAPFRGIAAQHGMAELTQVRRQRHEWQRTATTELAAGRTRQALAAYEENGAIVAVEERAQARSALLARWARDGKAEPKASQLVLAYTRDDVRELNTAIRTLRGQRGQLGKGQGIATEQGRREFSVHDRIRFGRNEKTLGVKNGSLGTIERIEGGVLQVKLDGPSDTRVAVDTKFYKHLDHGYAATVHKAQGSTVDRTYVLATPHFDRHAAYVALSRHRETATVFYARDDFGARGGAVGPQDVQARFVEKLSRARAKDLAHDYLERGGSPTSFPETAAAKPERDRKADRFKGLKLKPRREIAAEPQAKVERPVDRSIETPAARRGSELIRALDGFARAYNDATRMRDRGLPILEHQKVELRKVTAELDRVRPGAVQDLLNAVKYEPATAQILKAPPGPERAGELLATLEHEARVRTDPQLKAGRVLKMWNRLEAEHEKARDSYDEGPRKQLEKELQSLTREIKTDPELTRWVLKLRIELDDRSRRLDRVLEERDLNRALRLSIDRGRDFGLSL